MSLLQSQSKHAVIALDNYHSKEYFYYHLRNANLQKQGNTNQEAKDLKFASNEDFWNKALSSAYGERIGLRWVELIGFQVVDWFPRTPGLYHTSCANHSRKDAERYVREENGILFYNPHGKFQMILGGVGSVRFKPITLDKEEYWLCTATSDNVCHTGIPVTIPDQLMNQADFAFNRLCKIVGQVRFLPEFLESHFRHMSKIPQIYIQVDSIEQLGTDEKPSVNITPIVFFNSEREMDMDSKNNVTYFTCRANSTQNMDTATEWIEHYVNRYDGKIITNFDQQQPIFANAPFSLQNVMEGKLDTNILNQYNIEKANLISEAIDNIHVEAATMTKICVKLGDGNTVQGNLVVANTIQNSFNNVDKSEIPDELKDLLKQLAKSVAKMSEKLPSEIAEQAVRDLESLTVEATSKTPRKQWWQLSMDGLTNAAKSIGEIGEPVLELVAKLAPFLPAISG